MGGYGKYGSVLSFPQLQFISLLESFAYDLVVQRGIVRGRVALLLRSAEIQPCLPGSTSNVRAPRLTAGHEVDCCEVAGAIVPINTYLGQVDTIVPTGTNRIPPKI